MRRSVIGHDWLSFFGGGFFLGGGGGRGGEHFNYNYWNWLG